jgi:hypothetical protein
LLKVVLINASTAYVLLAGQHEADDNLFSIDLADIDRVQYLSPIRNE